MSYPIESLSEAKLLLPKWDLEEAVGVVTLAAKDGHYVSVRVEDNTWPDEGVTETRLVDVSTMSEDEYIAYRQAGGQWRFVPAEAWLES